MHRGPQRGQLESQSDGRAVGARRRRLQLITGLSSGASSGSGSDQICSQGSPPAPSPAPSSAPRECFLFVTSGPPFGRRTSDKCERRRRDVKRRHKRAARRATPSTLTNGARADDTVECSSQARDRCHLICERSHNESPLTRRAPINQRTALALKASACLTHSRRVSAAGSSCESTLSDL